MSGLATIAGRRAAVIDGDSVPYLSAPVGALLPTRAADPPISTQFVKFCIVEYLPRRYVEATVNRLVRNPHLRIGRVLAPEPGGDLLR